MLWKICAVICVPSTLLSYGNTTLLTSVCYLVCNSGFKDLSRQKFLMFGVRLSYVPLC